MTSAFPAPMAKRITQPAVLGDPDLAADELAEFTRHLAGAENYLEFGAGGSTVLAARARLGALVAVDSDPAWAAAVRRDADVTAAIAAGRASVLHADIGAVGRWGTPMDTSQAHKWPDYAAVAFAEWTRRGAFSDLVFVDGRFRVACCLATLLAAQAAGAKPPVVLLHDFNAERAQYRDVLAFYGIERQVGELVVLQARGDVRVAEVEARMAVAWAEVR